MSRLLRDATKANMAGRTAAPIIEERFDDFDEFEDEKPAMRSPEPAKAQRTASKKAARTLDDIPFDAKTFAKEFFDTLEDFGNLRKVVPDEINTFIEYDRFLNGSLPEIRLEIRIEMQKLNQEMQNTFSNIRKLEFMAENAIKINRDKGVVVGLLYERKDLQNKVAILAERKTKLMKASELLEMFELFAELSRDFGAYQKVSHSFVNEQKVYFPEENLDPDIKMSLAYGQVYTAANAFEFDKEPIHDYTIIEMPQNGSKVKEQIELEYQNLVLSLPF